MVRFVFIIIWLIFVLRPRPCFLSYCYSTTFFSETVMINFIHLRRKDTTWKEVDIRDDQMNTGSKQGNKQKLQGGTKKQASSINALHVQQIFSYL